MRHKYDLLALKLPFFPKIDDFFDAVLEPFGRAFIRLHPIISARIDGVLVLCEFLELGCVYGRHIRGVPSRTVVSHHTRPMMPRFTFPAQRCP